MLYISGRYALVIITFDIIIITTSLLFRKPKRRTEISTLDRRSKKQIGYYLVVSSIVTLLVGHYASYMSYLTYLEGLLVDGFLFYTGLKVVTQGE
jgi:hypothetical protein